MKYGDNYLQLSGIARRSHVLVRFLVLVLYCQERCSITSSVALTFCRQLNPHGGQCCVVIYPNSIHEFHQVILIPTALVLFQTASIQRIAALLLLLLTIVGKS